MDEQLPEEYSDIEEEEERPVPTLLIVFFLMFAILFVLVAGHF